MNFTIETTYVMFALRKPPAKTIVSGPNHWSCSSTITLISRIATCLMTGSRHTHTPAVSNWESNPSHIISVNPTFLLAVQKLKLRAEPKVSIKHPKNVQNRDAMTVRPSSNNCWMDFNGFILNFIQLVIYIVGSIISCVELK